MTNCKSSYQYERTLLRNSQETPPVFHCILSLLRIHCYNTASKVIESGADAVTRRRQAAEGRYKAWPKAPMGPPWRTNPRKPIACDNCNPTNNDAHTKRERNSRRPQHLAAHPISGQQKTTQLGRLTRPILPFVSS